MDKGACNNRNAQMYKMLDTCVTAPQQIGNDTRHWRNQGEEHQVKPGPAFILVTCIYQRCDKHGLRQLVQGHGQV